MFYLDKPKAESSYIMLSVYCEDGRLRYSTEKTVKPSNWHKPTERVLVDTDRVNKDLDKLEQAVSKYLKELKLEDKPLLRAGLKSMLDKLLGRGQLNWVSIAEEIIRGREEGRELTTNGKRFSTHTIKAYRHSLSNLMKCSNATGVNLSFEKVTLKTYRQVIEYFNVYHDHALNSVGKTIKNWKALGKAARRDGHHDNPIFEHEEFRVPSEETFDIALNDQELRAIYKYAFAGRLETARDWFIIDSYCGLRICDIQVLTKKNIEDGYIRLANEKTDIAVMIPFHPYVKAIIDKYEGLPPKMSDQKLNAYIKEVAQQAGIKGTVLYSVTKGGVRKDYYLEKWQMVSNHTARRSFITNLLKAGVPHTQVMRLAGIKKLSTLQRYDKQTIEETAEAMKKHQFFAGQ
ncbi:MAG TPA: site-specific integrase [Chitinophagaceae bacterium]|nr:site-specific integrase [Chitinophagaceae bacterium]